MKNNIKFIVVLVFFIALAYGAWLWFFCRFYVPPAHMAVVTAKMIGKPLPQGQILAKKGQMGVQEDVLAEGRHFLNPFLYDHRILPVVTIEAGKVGVVTSKVGEDLPSGEFLANVGQKGVWRSVLGPGTYRMNPVGYQVDVVDAISIPIGYVGVLTSLSGQQAPEGQFAGPNEKGVRADILQPGLYYANPKEYKIDVLEIGVNQVSLLGKMGGAVLTKNTAQQVDDAQQGQQGGVFALQQNALRAQQKAREEYVSKSSLLDVFSSTRARSNAAEWQAQQRRGGGAPAQQMQQQAVPTPQAAPGGSASFVLNQYVEFPSRDGFEISLDMTVEFELLPERIAGVFRTYGDLPAVVEKALMPQILSISRLKGSAYKVTDFIVGEGREKFQDDLRKELERTLEERQIKVHNALIRHVNVPAQILDPIQQASIAVEQDLTNKEKQNTAKKQAELNTETSMIEQRGEQVKQETSKLQAEMRAQQDKEVAEIGGEALKQVSEIENETATVRAKMTRTLGQAKADTVRLVDGEKALGFRMKIEAFGDPQAYSLWEFAKSLNPEIKVNVIHAGEGTLWTDLNRAGLGELGGARVIQQSQTPPAPAAKAK